MAFVYEVERPSIFHINKDASNIGTGKYLPLSSYKFEKPNAVPFGTSEKRDYPFILNQFPGPGSYISKEDNINLNPKLTKKKESKNITEKRNGNKNGQLIKNKIRIIKKNNPVNEGFLNKENLGFSTKVERFRLKNQVNTPGPGTYDDKDILLAKSIEEKCTNKKEIIYKINNDRHNIFYVNRNNNQFPWNSDVIIKKSKSKNKKIDIYDKRLNKNETIIIENNAKINKKTNTINKYNKKSGKNKNYKYEADENKLNLTDTNINTNENYRDNVSSNGSRNNNNSINNNNLKKNKTTINFYLPDTGVGIDYPKLSKKEIKQKLEKEMNLQKLQNDIKYRISSIPSKFSAGYEIEKKSGKVVRKPIRTNFKIFSGEKDDAVGPGSYEINLPGIWGKIGTCWSKYLCEKEPLKNRPKSGNDLNEKNLINDNKLDKHFRKIVNKRITNKKSEKNKNIPIINFFKSYSKQQIIFKDPTAHNIDIFIEGMKKNKLPSFIPVNNVPGPGYYYDEEKNNKNIRNNRNSFSYIKKINHFHEYTSKNNLNEKWGLGPGTYFNDILNLDNNLNKDKSKKGLYIQKNRSAPFLTKEKRFTYDKPINYNNFKNSNKINNLNNFVPNNISVESSQTSNSTHKFGNSKKNDIENELINSEQIKVKKNIKMHPQSMSGTFYRKDMRFRENYQEENMKKEIPGPGSYIDPYTRTGKSNSVKIDDKYMDIRSCRIIIGKNRMNKFNKNRKKEKDKISWIGDNKEIRPSVGTYEPDKTFTIEYDINKNKKYGNNAFNSTQFSGRNGFFLFQKNLPNGPGCYYKDKSVEFKQIDAAFNSTEDRFYKGGKNNTREIYKIPKRSLSVIAKKLKNDKENNNNEICFELKEKNIREKQLDSLGTLNNSNTPDIVGPGTYNYLPEVYPWIKQSYNVKFI